MPKIIAFTKSRNNSNFGSDSQSRYPEQHDDDVAGVPKIAEQIVVSVVVPTCGRPDLLSRCLAALILQRFESSRFEIVVVDDRPDRRTREVVMDWASHAEQRGPLVTYIASPGPHGPAAARNYGWRAARGSIVAFTDDDTVPRADWLEKGLNAFEDSTVDAVWGRIIMPLNRTPTDYELDAKGLERAEFVTANCFCRKSVLERIGGFDERFRVAWREDADLYFNLIDANAKIKHVPGAVIVHPIRPAKWGVSLSQQKKVLFDALLYKKHPDLYRKKIRARPRWDYYLIVFAILAMIGGLASASYQVAAAAAGIWLLLTARFCIMRLRRTVKKPAHILEMAVTSALIPPLAVFWRVVGAIKFRTLLL